MRHALHSRESPGARKRETQDEVQESGRADRPFEKISQNATTQEEREFIRDHGEKFGSISKARKRVEPPVSNYYYQPRASRAVTTVVSSSTVRIKAGSKTAHFGHNASLKTHLEHLSDECLVGYSQG
jgi:hypothetical protein